MTSSTSPRRLLVTGHRGFVGQSLQAWLPHSAYAGRFELILPEHEYDIRRAQDVHDVVRQARPDAVLHMAAQSFVPAAFNDPAGTFDVNVNGTLHLLQALRDEGFAGRLLFVSSADVYGAVEPQALPVTERHLPAPRNPYAVSKLAAETLCRQWHFTEGMDVVIARPFNHTGPGQEDRFAVSGFAHRIARIVLGLDSPRLVTGNLAVTRDFSDVRDVLAAYCRLLESGRAGEVYNVCAGVETRLDALVARMLESVGLQVALETDPALLRPNEQLRMVGSSDKLRADTGWAPVCDFDDTLATLVEWWRQQEYAI